MIMKLLKLLAAGSPAFLLLGLEACSDNSKAPDPQNRAPEAFELISVPDEAEGVDVFPEFSWNAATDPDGDMVTYTIYLEAGQGIDPTTEIAADITATSFTPEEPFLVYRDYSWKVVAKDGKGGETSSQIFEFEIRQLNDAVQTTANAAFTPRTAGAAVAFKGKLWVIGGNAPGAPILNDVWNTTDGDAWTQISPDAAFSPRYYHTALVYDDKLWVIGGYDGHHPEDNAWFSADGSTWTEAVNANFGPRYGHSSVVFDGKMWIIGGHDGNSPLSDVWSTSDGITWSHTTLNNAFSPRYGHSSVVYDGKIWVIGGFDGSQYSEELWYSSDGIAWTKADKTLSSSFAFHTSSVFSGALYSIAGRDGTYKNKYIDFYSTHNNQWMHFGVTFPSRYYHCSAVFDNKLWIIGGYDGADYLNDVWYMD